MINLLKILYYILIVILTVVPISGFSKLKMIIFFFFLCLLSFFVLLKKNELKFTINSIILLVFFSLFLLYSMEISIFHGYFDEHLSFLAFRGFFFPFILVFLSYYLFKWKIVCFEKFFNTVFLSYFVFVFIKLFIFTLLFCNIIDYKSLLQFLKTYFSDLVGNTSFLIINNVPRITLSNDVVGPFIYAILLIKNKIGINTNQFFTKLFLILSPVIIFQSFTRYFWFIYVVTIILYIVLFGSNIKIKSLIKEVIFVIFIVILIFSNILKKDVATFLFALNQRFSFDSSLEIKCEQSFYLLKEFEQYKFLGKGLATSSEEYIRKEKVPFSYEVQWLSFLLQFGIIGTGVILFYLFIIGNLIWPINQQFKFYKIRFYISILYLLWLLSGFTNPYLSGVTSSIIYTFFVLLGLHLRLNTQRWKEKFI